MGFSLRRGKGNGDGNRTGGVRTSFDQGPKHTFRNDPFMSHSSIPKTGV